MSTCEALFHWVRVILKLAMAVTPRLWSKLRHSWLRHLALIPIRCLFYHICKALSCSCDDFLCLILYTAGYGSHTLPVVQRLTSMNWSRREFPKTLGVDFSGLVVDVGKKAQKHFKPGDQVSL